MRFAEREGRKRELDFLLTAGKSNHLCLGTEVIRRTKLIG